MNAGDRSWRGASPAIKNTVFPRARAADCFRDKAVSAVPNPAFLRIYQGTWVWRPHLP